MFTCYVCGLILLISTLLLLHLKSSHFTVSHNRYVCKQSNCIREFQNAKAFKKHLDRKHNIPDKKDIHKSDNYFTSIQNQSVSLLLSDEVDILPSPHESESFKNVESAFLHLKNIIKNSAGYFVAKLHNQTAVPRNVVQNCISFNQDFLHCGMFEVLKEKVFSVFEKQKSSEKDKIELETMFSIASDPLLGFETEYKRIEYFKKTGFLVEPKSYIIGEGKTYKLINGIKTEENVKVEGQFISVQKVFLGLPGFLNIILDYMEYLYNEVDPQYMCNIVHGKLWTEIRKKFESNVVIPLIIYFDEYETNNIAGSHTGVDKIGATYFMLPTLPPH